VGGPRLLLFTVAELTGLSISETIAVRAITIADEVTCFA
jgi:hypothetical protein